MRRTASQDRTGRQPARDAPMANCHAVAACRSSLGVAPARRIPRAFDGWRGEPRGGRRSPSAGLVAFDARRQAFMLIRRLGVAIAAAPLLVAAVFAPVGAATPTVTPQVISDDSL